MKLGYTKLKPIVKGVTHMTKIQKKYWVDILLLISGVICLATGYILDFHIIRSRELKQYHIWSGYVMTAAIVLHVIWNAGWLGNMTKQIFGKKK